MHCVYEAGPTGFALARQLLALGATCLLVRPRRLDRHGRRRKTDPLDAQHLAEDLAAHHYGRKGLLRPVRLPSLAEELRRLPVRERETLSAARHQVLNSAKGRALALGHELPKEWWRPRVLPKLLPGVPDGVNPLVAAALHGRGVNSPRRHFPPRAAISGLTPSGSHRFKIQLARLTAQ